MMEKKKRSPRSGILPKSPLVYEKHKAGCSWRLISFFDFRHGVSVSVSGKKLVSNKPHKFRDSAGNLYTKSQLQLLHRLHERCHCCSTAKTCRILDQEIAGKPKTRRKSVQGRMKNVKEETFDSLVQIVSSERKKSSSIEMRKECSEINLQGNLLGGDGSKPFFEALDILSSNKQLFANLLQDPNALSESYEVDDMDRIVLLNPRLKSSDGDSAYRRFKRLAKTLKFSVGSNKNDRKEKRLLRSVWSFEGGDDGWREMEKTDDDERDSWRKSGASSELCVFKRKKRVESEIFRTSSEIDVCPRRVMVERQHVRMNSSPVFQVSHALTGFENVREIDEENRTGFLAYGNQRCTESISADRNRYVSDVCSSSRNVHDLKQEHEHPSPVSVLERSHFEDYALLPSFEEQIGLKSWSEKGSEFVKKVLETSISSKESSSLLEELSPNINDHLYRHLVLDYTNEILREINREWIIKRWPFAPLKTSLDLVHQAMQRFDWSLIYGWGAPKTLELLIDKDLKKTSNWIDFGGELEEIVVDIVEKLLEQLEMEISSELATMATRRSKLLRVYSVLL